MFRGCKVFRGSSGYNLFKPVLHNHADADPTNYLTYFKRAAVYLAIGQAKRAIPDLDKTIELKPDFSQVHCSRPYVPLVS